MKYIFDKAMRCLRYFLAGMIWRRPVPYNDDFRCWIHGSFTTGWLIFAAIIGAIFGAGFLVGFAIL